jgi:hypothetical protein
MNIRLFFISSFVILNLALSAQAGFSLGFLGSYFQSSVKDPIQELYTLANRSDVDPAEYFLGSLSPHAKTIIQSPKKFIESLQYAVQRGDSEAENTLGVAYLLGLGVRQDLGTAKQLLQLSASHNNPWGQQNLGSLYYFGIGVATDQKQALELFQKSATQGNSYAQNSLGSMYSNGLGGLTKSLKKAAELFEWSAAQGNPWGQLSLGYIYSNGPKRLRDYTRAFHYYQLAAKQNNSWAKNNLAVLYKSGLGVPKSEKRAFTLLTEATQQGNRSAQFNLGTLYQNGTGISQNRAKAFELFEDAAKNGSDKALHRIGLMYRSGDGVPENQILALEFFEKASALGNESASIIASAYRAHETPKFNLVVHDPIELNPAEQLKYFQLCKASLQQMGESEAKAEAFECPICLSHASDLIIPSCILSRSNHAGGAQVPAHAICRGCFNRLTDDKCPICRHENILADTAEAKITQDPAQPKSNPPQEDSLVTKPGE